MKKIFTILLILFVVTAFGFGQRSKESVQKQPVSSDFNLMELGQKDNDTIVLSPGKYDEAEEFVLYTVEEGGYVVGSNDFGDLAQGQVFKNDDPYSIIGVYYWVGEIEGEGGEVHFKVWNFDKSPGEVLDSKTVPVEEITATDEFEDLDELFYVEFEAPVDVDSDFMVGLDVSNIGEAEIGLISSAHGEGGEQGLAWVQWDNGEWNTMIDTWEEGDIDICVFPLVDATEVGIEEEIAAGNFNIYPNPVRDKLNIYYEKQINDVKLFNISGKVVYEKSVGSVNAVINVADFQQVIYILQIITKDGVHSRKIQVSR